jgi:hypothetical protein
VVVAVMTISRTAHTAKLPVRVTVMVINFFASERWKRRLLPSLELNVVWRCHGHIISHTHA